VRQLLHARGLPASRTLTLAIDEGERALAIRVVATAQRLAAAAPARHTTVPPVPSAAVVAPAAAPRIELSRAVAASPSAASSVHATVARSRWPLVLAGTAAIAAMLGGYAILRAPEPVSESAAVVPEPAPPSEPASARPPEAPLPPRAAEIDDAPVEVAEAPTAAPAVEDAPEVVAALRKRDVRALDLVVIAPEARKAAAFAGATAYCDALVIGELDGWRLPEIGELLSISRAKMIRKGSFWSATKGDAFGDLRLVLVIKKERISPIPAGWDGGRVVCVRERA
jgi:hypothetical protein